MRSERRSAPKKSRRRAASRRTSSGVGGKLLVMAAVVAAVVFGVAIFFKVNTVEVQGNSIYSAEEIMSASGIQKGDNLFTLNKEAAAGSIKAGLPYVETVSVIRFLPDRVVIEVRESEAAFAVETSVNTTWLINSVGKALEQISDSSLSAAVPQDGAQGTETGTDTAQSTQTPDAAQKPSGGTQTVTENTSSAADGGALTLMRDGEQRSIPRILGVRVNSPVAGAVVTAENTAGLNAALAVIAELDGTGILDHLASIDVEKEYDILLQYDDRYEIRLGGTDDLEYKIDYLTVILDNLSDFQAGTIDLTFTDSSEARFYSKE